MNRIGWGIFLSLIGAGACASAPPPYERVASSESAIRGASEVGAEQIPQAALHLKLAQEQVQKAKALIKDGDNNAAAFVLLRAQVDAELALALARESKTQAEARQAIEKARAIGGGPMDATRAPSQLADPSQAGSPTQPTKPSQPPAPVP
jgi:hypothetical protein